MARKLDEVLGDLSEEALRDLAAARNIYDAAELSPEELVQRLATSLSKDKAPSPAATRDELDAVDRALTEELTKQRLAVERSASGIGAIKTIYGIAGGASMLLIVVGAFFGVRSVSDLNSLKAKAQEALASANKARAQHGRSMEDRYRDSVDRSKTRLQETSATLIQLAPEIPLSLSMSSSAQFRFAQERDAIGDELTRLGALYVRIKQGTVRNAQKETSVEGLRELGKVVSRMIKGFVAAKRLYIIVDDLVAAGGLQGEQREKRLGQLRSHLGEIRARALGTVDANGRVKDDVMPRVVVDQLTSFQEYLLGHVWYHSGHDQKNRSRQREQAAKRFAASYQAHRDNLIARNYANVMRKILTISAAKAQISDTRWVPGRTAQKHPISEFEQNQATLKNLEAAFTAVASDAKVRLRASYYSIVLNNTAFFYLSWAQYVAHCIDKYPGARESFVAEAKRLIAEARKWVHRAMMASRRYPVTYTTNAEVECYGMTFQHEQLPEKLSEEQKKQRLELVLRNMRRATWLGYEGYANRGLEDLVTDPLYQCVELVYPKQRERILGEAADLFLRKARGPAGPTLTAPKKTPRQ